jgi:hypothetical protein
MNNHCSSKQYRLIMELAGAGKHFIDQGIAVTLYMMSLFPYTKTRHLY